jgi:hypothetical protein
MLTRPQRSKCRKYLGVTSKFPDVDARLDQAMDQISGEPDDECLLIEAIGVCDTIDTAIRTLISGCLKVIQVDTTHLRGAYSLGTLRSIGKQYSGQISKSLGVPFVDGGHFQASGASRVPGPMGSGNFPPYG